MSIIERIGISFRIYWRELADVPEFERLEAIISAISTHDYIFRDALEAYFAEEGSELAGMGRVIFLELHRLYNNYLTSNLQSGQETGANESENGKASFREVLSDASEDRRVPMAAGIVTCGASELRDEEISLAYAGDGYFDCGTYDTFDASDSQPEREPGSADDPGADL